MSWPCLDADTCPLQPPTDLLPFEGKEQDVCFPRSWGWGETCVGTAGLGQYTCLHASRKCIKGNPGPSPRGMFYARGTGKPQMVNRRGASHCLSPVPISRLLGDIPAAPYLVANREMASSGSSHSSSVAVLSRSSDWHGTASAGVVGKPLTQLLGSCI